MKNRTLPQSDPPIERSNDRLIAARRFATNHLGHFAFVTELLGTSLVDMFLISWPQAESPVYA
jgi:hypothetical protein